ncbi:MAG: hypothetical protein L3J54_02225 [Draconibacterium sp.]|nr:hypothetical protein [Draconibacterium sp.]
MSLPENILLLKNLTKPQLKYQIGTTVFLNTDIKKRFLMIITDYVLDEDTCADYKVEWLNSQGVLECSMFPEECLIIKK